MTMALTIDDILFRMVEDAFSEEVAPNWIDGQEFSVIYLTGYVSNDTVRQEDVECIKDVLTDIAAYYGLDVKYDGDMARFAEKESVANYKQPICFTC